jgi:hypothetical protein
LFGATRHQPPSKFLNSPLTTGPGSLLIAWCDAGFCNHYLKEKIIMAMFEYKFYIAPGAAGDDCVEEKLLREHEAEAAKHRAEFVNYGAYSDAHEILSKTSKGKLASWIDPATMQVGHEWIPYKSNIDTLLDEY